MSSTSVVNYRSHQMRDSRIKRDWGGGGRGGWRAGPGSAGLHLAGGLPLLRPAEQAFEAMLDGWRNQQLARRLAFSTVEGRERAVRAFAAHADAFPWAVGAAAGRRVDDRPAGGPAVCGGRRCGVPDRGPAVLRLRHRPGYGWPAECETRFGTHPVQVVSRVERRGPRPGGRGRPVQAGVHQG